tara:strand:+ start:562 stop:912 length:351 start_codon:yes stop_codon:yes gene_type:complete
MRQFLAISVLAIIISGCASPEEKEAKACSDTIMAFVMSQNVVEKALKSPSTASFPSISDSNVNVVYLSNEQGCKHYVSAYVDSQNGFGATVRSTYQVIMSRQPFSDVWRHESLDIQ